MKNFYFVWVDHELHIDVPDRLIVRPDQGEPFLRVPEAVMASIRAHAPADIGEEPEGIFVSASDVSYLSPWIVTIPVIHAGGDCQFFLSPAPVPRNKALSLTTTPAGATGPTPGRDAARRASDGPADPWRGWANHRYGAGVDCVFTPRETYRGRITLPELQEKHGTHLHLLALWKMEDGDPYPGEWALGHPSGHIDELGRVWIASGDVTTGEAE